LVALIAVALAYLAQLPRFLARMGLAGQRLDLRLREFTGLALAMLLLAFGFFLAGVPLDAALGTAVSTPDVTQTPAAVSNESLTTVGPDVAVEAAGTETAVLPTGGSAQPESGAFGGPPLSETDAATAVPTLDNGIGSDTVPDETVTATQTPQPTTTVTTTGTPLPTNTATATPTVTATPTLTPTPIDGETARINTGGSTLWIRRTPGGQTLTLVRNGDLVLISTGHANQGGILWQEIRTVDGVLGWVQEEFLTASE
ncbi:MAG: hypothetical protein KC419_21160, partial [Anaerolineales bacterium]|nr:hypothetical protein [Anaerolineales bacterium]